MYEHQHGAGMQPAQMQPEAGQRLRRTLLYPIGPAAQAIGAQIEAYTRRGLPVDAPLQVIGGAAAQMTAALDALASTHLAQQLQQRGFVVDHPDEIHVWLLIDLTAADGAVVGAVDGAVGGTADGGAAGGEQAAGGGAGAAAASARWCAALEKVAWQRLRAQLIVHVVLLVEPAQQAIAAVWRSAGPPGANLYLAGTVNAAHLRLEEEAWRDGVAQAVTALLWSPAPTHSRLARATGGGQQAAALGAALWCSPARVLQEALALTWVAELVRRLQDELGQRSEEVVVRTLLPDAECADLLRLLSPVGEAMRWRSRQPAWRSLAQLPALIARTEGARAAQVSARNQALRLEWLDAAQAAWNAQAEAEVRPLLESGWPQLGRYGALLQAVRKQTDAAAAAADAQLIQLAARKEQVERRGQAAQAALAAECAAFPRYTLGGAMAAALQPWRWPGWLWRYFITLPEAAQAAADAQAELRQIEREEAAWHVLRQHYLACAQTVQGRLKHLLQLEQVLEAVKGVAHGRAAALEQAVGAAWNGEELKWLLGQTQPAGPGLATMILGQAPPLTWCARSVEELIDSLVAQAAPAFAAVARWPATECLAALLAMRRQASAEAGPAQRWLERALFAALPLWPPQTAIGAADEECWLITPALQELPGALGDAIGLVEQWQQTCPALMWSIGALEGVVVVRWCAVQLDDAAGPNWGSDGEVQDEAGQLG